MSWRPESQRVPEHGKTTHGRTYDPIYEIWCGMIKRCYNRKHKDWRLYGGKGIRVCARWRHTFAAFLADMGERPSPKHSIDRRDGTKGYSPENCRWATAKEQANNTAANRRLTYNGVTRTLSQWADVVGIDMQLLSARNRAGWSVERVLTKPATNLGGGHGGAKLTERDVRAIRRSSKSSPVLARVYPVTARYIRRIRTRERWSYLDA
jgi:hypothetical protein